MFYVLAAIVFIVMIAVLVLAHEFGHFIVAKKSGMKVDEFGFGFPPRIFAIRKGETEYSLNWIPLGGFVKILGEDNSDGSDPRSFVNKSFFPRLLTLLAGIVMNVILAAVLFAVGAGIGLPAQYSPGDQLPAHTTLQSQGVTVVEVQDGTPAAQAGIREGDVITAINGMHFSDADDTLKYLQTQSGQTVHFTFDRQGATVNVAALDRANPPAGQGAIGLAVDDVGTLRYAWYAAPWFGIQQTWYTIEDTVVGFYQLIRSGIGISDLGGPVKIAQLTSQATRLGPAYVIQFAAYLSINLAILNAVPFPALDGGRVLFLFIEKIRRKPNNPNVEGWVNTVGFFALIALILVISAHDVFGLFHH